MNDSPSFSWATCQCTLVFVGMALFLWGCRLPGGDVLFVLAGAAVWLLIGLWIVLQLLVRLIQIWRKKRERGSLFAGAKSWRVAFLAIIGSIALALVDAPLRLAFAISRPSLERIVQRNAEGRPQSGFSGICLFPIAYVSSEGNGQTATLALDKYEIFYAHSYLYFDSSGAAPKSSDTSDYKRLDKNWYSFRYTGW